MDVGLAESDLNVDCFDENTAIDLLDGRVSEQERVELEAHADECPSCRRLLSDVAAIHLHTVTSHTKQTRETPSTGEPVQTTMLSPGGKGGVQSAKVRTGTLIAERYRLEQELGRGGMGSVWVAYDLKLHREVAFKIMASSIAQSSVARERFEREALAVAGLRSPHIVQLYDYGIEQGDPYMVMELLEGEDLGARLVDTGRLPPLAAITIVGQIAKGLNAAHRAHIVHRDLKPANIFLVRDEEEEEIVKIVDFGIAKARQQPGSSSQSTTDGALMGTPRYMSPEQVHGAKKVDHRADLWALGVIAYCCLTGRIPFNGKGLGELYNQILNDVPKPPSELVPELPEEVDVFFKRALAKEPDERFQTALQFGSEFAAVLADSLTVSQHGALAALGMSGARSLPKPALALSEPHGHDELAADTTTENGVVREASSLLGETGDDATTVVLGKPRRSKLGFAVAALIVASVAGVFVFGSLFESSKGAADKSTATAVGLAPASAATNSTTSSTDTTMSAPSPTVAEATTSTKSDAGPKEVGSSTTVGSKIPPVRSIVPTVKPPSANSSKSTKTPTADEKDLFPDDIRE